MPAHGNQPLRCAVGPDDIGDGDDLCGSFPVVATAIALLVNVECDPRPVTALIDVILLDGERRTGHAWINRGSHAPDAE